MNINWKVRLQNKIWVMGFLSQLFILTELVLIAFKHLKITEYTLSHELETWMLAVVNVVFGLFSMIGLVQDPTTQHLSDSKRALTYRKPN
ncbi:phage holin [uncultured Psychrobacillus sp.]|uniref:phage holin n=1 Tax=uncultured Psychrobacillus sp. TaxID=1551585 RepID=UPI00262F61FE|nr:phage holin [uncultured Psychrobacillus sp.]